MNDEPMIEIPVVVNKGQIQCLHGALPALKEGIHGSLIMPVFAFKNQKDIERFTVTGTVELFPAGTVLYAPMKSRPGTVFADSQHEQIILEEPLRLTFRGTKRPFLEACQCTLPALGTTVSSINEAYTRLSEKFETHRRSHTGNVFQKVFYRPQREHNLQSLDGLRIAKQIEFEEKCLQSRSLSSV